MKPGPFPGLSNTRLPLLRRIVRDIACAALLPVVLLAGQGGCAPRVETEEVANSANDSGSTKVAEPATASPAEPVKPVRPTVAVGQNPRDSMGELAAKIRAAMESYDEVYRLVYPSGWVRHRLAVETVEPEFVESPSPEARITVRFQDRNSVIRNQREVAAAEEELFPRAPKVDRIAILNDGLNPPLPSEELVLFYESREGNWHLREWNGPGRQTRGADFPQRVGLP